MINLFINYKMKCTVMPETLLLKLKYIHLFFFPEDLLCIVEDSDKLNQLFGPAVIKICALQKTL